MFVGDLKEWVTAKDGRINGSLDLMEVARSFGFLDLPLKNPTTMDDFKHERKAHT